MVAVSWKEPQPVIPIVISILGAIGWLVFILWHTFFWSTSFTLFQNIVIAISSFLVVAALMGLTWVVWGFRAGEKWFSSVLKEAGIDVTDENEEKIAKVIHEYIGECARTGRCSFNWTKASKEIEADEQMKKGLKERLQSIS